MTTLSPTNGFAPQASPNVPSQFSKMTSEDFVRIIFTELAHQDPFQPNDSQALLNQLNSIRSIESDIRLTEQLENLVGENQLASASNMIGKFIGGLTYDNFRVAGYVVAVIRVGNSVNLELDNGWIVPMSGVEQVIDATPPPSPPPPNPPIDDPTKPPDDPDTPPDDDDDSDDQPFRVM